MAPDSKGVGPMDPSSLNDTITEAGQIATMRHGLRTFIKPKLTTT